MPKHYARIRGGRPINIMGCRPWERRRQKRWLKAARLAECGKRLDDRNKTWYYIQLRPTMADMRHNEKIHLQKCIAEDTDYLPITTKDLLWWDYLCFSGLPAPR